MTIDAGVGTSEHRNPAAAVTDAVAQARVQLGGERVDFALLFVTVGHRLDSVLAALREALPGVRRIGCTAEGIISSAGSTEGTHGLTIALFRSDGLRFVPFGVGGLRASAEQVGARVGQQLAPELASGDARALVLLPDGLSFNFDAFQRGMGHHVPPTLPIVGGLAGDNLRMEETRQFVDDEVFVDGVVGALLVGEAELRAEVTHGCVPLGLGRTVTRATGNVIEQIDGEPALDVIKGYLGFDIDPDDWIVGLAQLAVGLPDADDGFTIRSFPAIDEARGTVTIPTEIATGQRIWLVRRDFEKIREGVDRIAGRLHEAAQARPPSMVLHFDCAGRGRMFLTEEERLGLLRRLHASTPAHVPWIGMYSFGELAPVRGANAFHSYTAAVVTVR